MSKHIFRCGIKRRLSAAVMLLCLAVTFSSYADIISDAPDMSGGTASGIAAPPVESAAPPAESAAPAAGSQPDTGASGSGGIMAPSDSGSDTVLSDVPIMVPGGTAVAASTVRIMAPGSTNISVMTETGPGPGASVSGTGLPGEQYINDAKTRIELGFTLVSPVHSYNGLKVAEGSVQLADGSWASIGYDKYIRQPYFRLLREEGDWYVVAVHASRIGNYNAGTVVDELWLKKPDCTAQSYIEVNTANEKRIDIVRDALSLLGKGYQYAGNGPDAYDCSGLVKSVMSSSGISIARTSSEICNAGTEVGITGLRPGDIVGRNGHVGIYIGNGVFVHAAESASGVITEDLQIYNSNTNSFKYYRNVIGD